MLQRVDDSSRFLRSANALTMLIAQRSYSDRSPPHGSRMFHTQPGTIDACELACPSDCRLIGDHDVEIGGVHIANIPRNMCAGIQSEHAAQRVDRVLGISSLPWRGPGGLDVD